MRVLLSFEFFSGFGGTETYALTVAKELHRLGHEAAIYSPLRGAMAEFAREQGVPVLGSEQLPRSCDLVIASDTATCHELSGRYLDARIVCVVHSADGMLQAPPQLRDRAHAIVVLNDRVRRAVDARAWHAPVTRLRQPIDLHRYNDLGPCRATSRTALVTTNYVQGMRAKLIEDGCRAAGLQVRWLGATTQPTPTPEFAIADADLVIGLGRSVLEGMAAGRAAYVYGVLGGDGWVTPERYPAMEADGFAGMSCAEIVIDAERMAADLAEWNAQMGEVNRDLASGHHNAREHAIALIDLARGVDCSPPAEVSLSDELAQLVRLQWRSEIRAASAMAETIRLRASFSDLELEAARAREQCAQLAHANAQLVETAQLRSSGFEHEAEALRTRCMQAEADLARLRATRRYRLACRLAQPLDGLRNTQLNKAMRGIFRTSRQRRRAERSDRGT